MFLKRIDVAGFKSFAERIQVEFVQGVTAVVGPNGSGKSNISDAVRWVLGEQSAKSLRGSKMEDIIFAGSDNRKPLNVAEVTLTLDNEDQHLPLDYNEISITRRVYRSGDSEYLINKQQCRLKDIVELFMDSGLGREAFSIIGQGRVEEILSSKSEERRKIFEEAAGVLKYKTRKHKAEQKLFETQENLNRVEDILHELEGQVEPLKIQASIAKDYLDKKQELEIVETAVLVQEIEDLHERWEKQKTWVAELQKQESELSAKVKQGESAIERARLDMQAMDESIDELQGALLLASETLEKLEGKKEVLKERKKNYDQNKTSLLEQIQQLKVKKEQLETQLRSEKSILTDKEKQLKAVRKQVSEEESRLTVLEMDVEAELEKLKSDYFERLNEQTTIRNEMRYIEDQAKQQTFKSSRLDEENNRFLQQREEIKNKREQAEKSYKEAEAQLKEKQEEYQKLKAAVSVEEQESRSLQEKLYQAYQYIQQFKSKKEMLESMQDEYAGFMQGVKEVLKAKETKLPGIQGAVAELLSVPSEVETAIETALGASMQHVVVDRDQNAMKAIQFLKQTRAGRATFLPLNVIKSRNVSSADVHNARTVDAFVGVAADLVQYDQKYKNIVGNLLGNIIISRDLAGANAIAKKVNYRYRIVTLEGDVVSPGGSMSGGSLKQKSSSLLSRQREVEALTEKLASMQKQTLSLEDKVSKLKEKVVKNNEALDRLQAEGEKLRELEQELKSNLRELEIQEKSLNDRLQLYDREKHTFESEKSAADHRLSKLKKKLEEAVKSGNELEKTIADLTEKKKMHQSSKEELRETLTKLKIKAAELEQQVANQKEKSVRLEEEFSDVSARSKETEEDYWLLEEEMNSSSSGEDSLDEQIMQKRHEKNTALKLIAERRQERTESFRTIESMEVELKEAKRQYKQLSDGLKTEEVSINRLDVELESRLTHLREEYELSYEGAKLKHKLEIPLEDAKRKVKLIKMAIEELGVVNLGAIEEYERVSQRYEFLIEQRDDLTEAKNTLYGVISEMDEEMKNRFEETFTSIRSHFGIIFKELFGGGRADLVLTQPEDMLATGVDIMAQPPGKKLQQLGLLSGGERALTAIALLFAILKVRPVPFCILDEVEAALDDANVNRFAKYLRTFSKETQFIVVTHRKGTMEEADVLYGVTMQESGVSKLVSVRLEETKELVTS
ncbi:chromosome segregation protein SMC [Fictibacillus phosphorivorans]|uniref:chromosome segregation protein SMC n=1 Tax=Fictibacillus phosphorivorans TaxID=1221500 RepID=UPI00203A6D8C|nr:chromosome segregation protein SMC [Fictibacillus phosphorivorans]MCM3717189.1 chromosome segregation protein SMC [Fictibacillus phosphorivorans]MCM3774876.1 chromosome segregation protein SMC [Fictibacillus phosphorivorans]